MMNVYRFDSETMVVGRRNYQDVTGTQFPFERRTARTFQSRSGWNRDSGTTLTISPGALIEYVVVFMPDDVKVSRDGYQCFPVTLPDGSVFWDAKASDEDNERQAGSFTVKLSDMAYISWKRPGEKDWKPCRISNGMSYCDA